LPAAFPSKTNRFRAISPLSAKKPLKIPTKKAMMAMTKLTIELNATVSSSGMTWATNRKVRRLINATKKLVKKPRTKNQMGLTFLVISTQAMKKKSEKRLEKNTSGRDPSLSENCLLT